MGERLEYRALRSRLLVGVAAAAIAVPLAGKANAQTAPSAPKWSPWVEAGGMVGTRSFGDVDFFIPLWQDQGSLLFGDLRGTFSAQPTEEGNFGLGYRTQISPEWILGGYGYFDIANSANNNLFYQVTLGVELKSVDWDFRVNGYIPINPDGGNIKNNSNPSIHISGNTIQMQTESQGEKALYGFDGEVGWRVPLFPADGDFDVRVYAGGYYFTNSDVDTIAGPRGRIEARLYDIDFLGLQSRLTAQGVVQWDAPRGVQGFGGLELRIPLGAITGAPGPKLNPLDRRMVDRVQRDVDIVTEKTQKQKQNEDVIVDELTVSTHTIVFANSGGTGSGAKGDPTDLNNVNGALDTTALNNGTGSNAIILVDGSAGTVGVNNPFQLLNGQALIGGGSVVPLTGVKSGKTVDFSFSGTTPTLVGNDRNENLIEMAFNKSFDTRYQNEIFGVIMDGSQGGGFLNGVHGVNMYRAIVKNSTITSAFANGIFLENEFDGAVPPSAFVHIEGNVVSDNGENGILIATNIDPRDLESHTQTIIINSNTITYNGFHRFPSQGNAAFTDASGSNPGNGIYITNRATGTGSLLSQSVAILDNVISHNDEQGIRLHNEAREDGDISQFVVIDPNTIDHNGEDGILASNFVSGPGSTIYQGLAIGFNFISHNGADGILVDTFAEFGGFAHQFTIVYNNSIYHNLEQGVAFRNNAFSGAIRQVAFLDFDTIDHNVDNGVSIFNGVSLSGSISQFVGMYSPTITNNGSNGIHVTNYGHDANSVLTQTVKVSSGVITDNGIGDHDSGVFVHNKFSDGASLLQSIAVDPSTIADNGGDGIHIYNQLSDGGTFSQHIVVMDSTITNNNSNGIFIETHEADAAFTQGVTISGNTISGNDSNGVAITANVYRGSLKQSVSITGNTISNNDSRGVYIKTRGYRASNISQNVYITGNHIDENRSDGIKVASYLSGNSTADGSFLTQNVTITGNSLHSNDDDAIQVDAFVSHAGGLSQSVNVSNNTIDGTGDNGVQMQLRIETAGVSTAYVTVSGNQISNIEGNGISIQTGVRSATLVEPNLVISNNTLNNIAEDGIRLRNFAYSNGLLSQNITINDNSISFVGSKGIAVYSWASGDGASLSQVLTIDPNTIVHVGTDSPEVAAAIYIRNTLTAGAAATQTLSIAGNFISDVTGDTAAGIFVSNKVEDDGAFLTQSVVVDDNTISAVSAGNSAAGIWLRNRVVYQAIASQTATIDDNTITGVSADHAAGIFAYSYASGAGARLSQALTIDPNTISGISGIDTAAGLLVNTGAYYHGRVTQTISVAGNQISAISGRDFAVGIIVRNNVSYAATISQSLTINDNTVSGVSALDQAAGVYVTNFVSNHSYLSQAVTIASNLVSSITNAATAAGIVVKTRVGYYASAQQSVTIDGNSVSGVSGGYTVAGIFVSNFVSNRSFLSQNLVVDSNTISNISASGIVGVSAAGIRLDTQASSANQTISILANQVSNISAGNAAGIAVNNRAYDYGRINQAIVIAANSVSNIANGDGILLSNFASDDTFLSQGLTLSANTVINNGDNGLRVDNFAYDSTITQPATITNNIFASNGDNGIQASNLFNGGAAGKTVMNWSMNGNHVTDNNDNGIRLYNSGGPATQFVTLGSTDIVTANGAIDVYLINRGAAVGNLTFHTNGATLGTLFNSGNNATVVP